MRFIYTGIFRETVEPGCPELDLDKNIWDNASDLDKMNVYPDPHLFGCLGSGLVLKMRIGIQEHGNCWAHRSYKLSERSKAMSDL